MESYDCDVAIVGCGPTGAVLANLLGQLGVRVVVLERDQDVYPVPRATHVDEETLRNFQATGLAGALMPHTALFGRIQVVDGDGRLLVEDRVEEPDSPHGYAGSRFFDQPAFERVLRGGLARYPHVELHLGAEVSRVEDRGDGATVHATRTGTGAELAVRASWVVGCDGGRSVVRAALGVETERPAPQRRWLIVDALLRDPDDAALLPDCFRYHVGPRRLSLYAHGVGRNRRWEFQLGDDEAAPAEADVIDWISESVDPARLDIVRLTTYAHTSMVAKTWRVGRVFVAGDAAHLMPPSAGQGMCSGIRDAINLAWKLHLVATGRAGSALLDTYERERKPHVRDMLETTLFVGRQLRADTPFERWQTKQRFRLAALVPGLRGAIRRRVLRRLPLRDGFLDPGSRLAGHPLPQVAVGSNGDGARLDDLLGYRFALVARAGALSDDDAAWAATRNVGVWRSGVDLDDAGALGEWLEAEGLDFALARPDRQLFAAGGAGELARVRAAFDRWLE